MSFLLFRVRDRCVEHAQALILPVLSKQRIEEGRSSLYKEAAWLDEAAPNVFRTSTGRWLLLTLHIPCRHPQVLQLPHVLLCYPLSSSGRASEHNMGSQCAYG